MKNLQCFVHALQLALFSARRGQLFLLCVSAFALINFGGIQAPYAQSKDECVAAYESGQKLRIEGKLLAARDSLLVCAQPACPSIVTGDCGQWLAEIDKTIPSIVVGVRTPDGKDLLEVSVAVDGQVVREVIDGKPIPLDPGPHALRVEAAGFEPYEETFVAQQGDKHRIVAITIKPIGWKEPAPAKPATTPDPVARSASPKPDSGVPTITYVLGGVSLAAFASTTYFGVSGLNDAADMERTCKPSCPEEDVDAARTKIVVANVTFGVGVAAAAGALWTYLASRPSSEERDAGVQANGSRQLPRKHPAVSFEFVPVRRGGVVGIHGLF